MYKEFKHLEGIPSDFSETFIKVDGDSLESLKKYLTIRNFSASYQLEDTRKRIGYWRARLNRNPDDGLAYENVERYQKMISKLSDEVVVKYYDHNEDGLFIPAGYWDLVHTGDYYNNTEIKPFLLDFLRPYQKECVAEVLKYKRAMFCLATGLGKTFIALSIALSSVKSGKRVIIITPSKSLTDQIYNEFKPFCDNITTAYSGKTPKLEADILISTYGTANKYVDNYDVCIIEESHHSVVKSITYTLSNAAKLTHVYGMTATPFREDGLDLALHAFCGPIVYQKDLRYGIDNDYLEHFDVHVLKLKITGFRIHNNWSRASAYKRIMENDKVLNVINHYTEQALKQDRKIIGLFKTLLPIKTLSKKMKHLNVKGANADYKKPIDDFKKGDISCILATNKLLSEGVDVPGADVLILSSMHGSNIVTFQAIGRVLRKGGKKPIIIDVNIVGYENFEKNIDKRLKIYEKFADNVYVKTITV